MSLPKLEVSVTCVRVPVPVGHSATMLLGTREAITAAAARAALEGFPGVEVVDDVANNTFPTARDVEGRDEVLVGRIRKDKTSDR
jgi:aspartate-semialdehyde dehydrogenase